MKTLSFAFAVLFAMLLMPAVASAGDRWSNHGSRGSDRGYKYDRGQRYHDRGHSSSRESYGFSFGYSNSGYGDSGFLGFGYSSGGYRHGGYGYGGKGYAYPRYSAPRYVAPPVVYRDDYYCATPRYYAPPVVYRSVPRSYYYDGCNTGSYYSGSAYYYKR